MHDRLGRDPAMPAMRAPLWFAAGFFGTLTTGVLVGDLINLEQAQVAGFLTGAWWGFVKSGEWLSDAGEQWA